MFSKILFQKRRELRFCVNETEQNWCRREQEHKREECTCLFKLVYTINKYFIFIYTLISILHFM